MTTNPARSSAPQLGMFLLRSRASAIIPRWTRTGSRPQTRVIWPPHSPCAQIPRPQARPQRRRDHGGNRSEAAKDASAKTRRSFLERYPMLHGSFPIAVDRTSHALGRWVSLRFRRSLIDQPSDWGGSIRRPITYGCDCATIRAASFSASSA
jgi:hypothetical protein